MAPVLSKGYELSRRFCLFSNAISQGLGSRIYNNKPPQTIIKRWIKRKSTGLGGRKIELAPVANIAAEPAGFGKLLKPFLFTISFCGCSYVGASIWQYENIRSQALSLVTNQGNLKIKSAYKQGDFRRKLNQWWNDLTDGRKIAIGIISVNVVVFLLWRIPALQPTMIRYFASNPSSKTVCLPMFLSTFSHYSAFHIFANMCVLLSFSTSSVNLFGKEQFLGLYLSAGVVSSFASYVYKISTRTLTPSLGASGAIMAIIASICVQYPNTQLAILFLPFLSFPAGMAIKAVMGLDFAGLVLKWRLFDHAAHLGGAIFGIGYLWYGQEYVWTKREPILRWWHEFREGQRNKPS